MKILILALVCKGCVGRRVVWGGAWEEHKVELREASVETGAEGDCKDGEELDGKGGQEVEVEEDG